LHGFSQTEKKTTSREDNRRRGHFKKVRGEEGKKPTPSILPVGTLFGSMGFLSDWRRMMWWLWR